MDTRPKILLADDDPDLLDLYRQILGQLPSRPEVHTAGSGARAMAMLEAEPFQLLICDLKMPKMDGLQVLAIVRRKYPQLRTVALTAEAGRGVSNACLCPGGGPVLVQARHGAGNQDVP